jgi:uncharacterized repeat protein (TIGR01451 family)
MIISKLSHISAALAATMALAWGTQAYPDIYAVHEVKEMKMHYDFQKKEGVVKDKTVTAEDILNALSAKDPAGGNEILAAFTNCENPDEVHIGVWNTNKEKIPKDSASITLTRGIFVEEESDDGKLFTQTANYTTEQLDGAGFGDSIDMWAKVEYSKLPKDLRPSDSSGMNKICVSRFKAENSVGSTREGSGVVTETKLKFLEPFYTQTSEPPITPVPPIEEVAAIALIKHIVGGDPYTTAGDEIDYEYEVANVGDLPILSLAVVDDKTKVDCGALAVLNPGDLVTCSASYTVTAADVIAGSVINKAAAFGVSTKPVEPVKSDAKATLDTSPPPAKPVLAMQKVVTTGNPFSGAGEKISYAYLVVNKGNESINGITVSDSLTTVDCGGVTSLDPGEKMGCTAAYDTTDLDVKRGWVVNKAVAKGLGNPSGTPVDTSTSATAKLSEVSVP